MANKKYKLTDGNMWATDGIHDFGQNKTQRTINSEVNTALGGKAPTNHASTSTTYGKGTSSNYGHVKISDSLTDTTPAATGGVVPSMKAVSDLSGAIKQKIPDTVGAYFAYNNPQLYTKNRLYISDFCKDDTTLLPAGKTEQAFAFYDSYIFQLCDNDYCIRKNLNGDNISGFVITCGHGNSVCFSTERYDPDDTYPLLYCSDITGDVYVNRITNTSATLVKTFYLDPSIYGSTPQLALYDSNRAYVVGGNNNTPPYYPITQVKISFVDIQNATESGGKYIPVVLDSFTVNLSGNDTIMQGIKYKNNNLYLASGGYSTEVKSRIHIIDPNERVIRSLLQNFTAVIRDNELEDIDFSYDPILNIYNILCFVREHGYYRLQMPISKKIVNPPNVLSSEKVGTGEANTSANPVHHTRLTRDGWYQVRAINFSISGECKAYMCNYDISEYYASAIAPDGSYTRSLSAWFYFSKEMGTNWVNYRIFSTDADSSGLFYAPEIQ